MKGLLVSSVIGWTLATGALASSHETSGDRGDHFVSLLHDNDWLTGVWRSNRDAAMLLFSLFEKDEDGYRVSHYYPRYSVTWWVGRVEKTGDLVRQWHYKRTGDQLSLPDSPHVVERFDGDTLSPLDRDSPGHEKVLVRDEELLRHIAERQFTTGKIYLQRQADRYSEIEKLVPRYSDVPKYSRILSVDWVRSIELIASNQNESRENYLFFVEVGDPPRSGYCGSARDRGFYWTSLHNNGGDDWTLEDFWSAKWNSCAESEMAYPALEDDGKVLLYAESFGQVGRRIEDGNCFFATSESLQKPQKCSKDMVDKLNRRSGEE